MIYVLLFLHIIALPAAIIATLAEGLYALAVMNALVFLGLFAMWIILKKPNA